MKKHARRITSLVAAAAMSTAMVSVMPMEASAATNQTYSNNTATFTYSIKDGTAEISDVAPKNVTNAYGEITINVPATINNYPVVLGSYSFYRMNSPIAVDCMNVSAIKSKAFFVCNGLSEIILRSNCKNIASSAFYDCDNLKRVMLQGSSFAVEDGSSLTIESYAFTDCGNLDYLSFGCRDDIIIKPNAFYGSMKLKNFDRTKASFDHCSLYVQPGAFNGTGIVNNSNAVKSASYMASHNGRYNCGDGKKMVGNVLIVNLLVNATDLPAYTYGSSYGANYGAGYNSWLLEEEAKKYGANLDIQTISATVSSKMKASEIKSCGDFTSRAVCLEGLKREYSFLSGCSSMTQATQALKQHYNADQIAYVVNLNADEGSFAYSFMQSKEYAVVFSKSTVSYNNGHVWMHEVCHLFGAMDVYEGRVNNDSYTSTYLNHDIMYHNEPNVGWFTACNLGWTDTVLAEDYNAVVRNDNSAVWIDRD